MQGQNAKMYGLGQAQRALLGTIADGLAVIDDSKAQLQTRAELPPLGSDPVSYISSHLTVRVSSVHLMDADSAPSGH